jgi:hypothetical protein
MQVPRVEPTVIDDDFAAQTWARWNRKARH